MIPFPLPPNPTLLVIGAGAVAFVLAGIVTTSLAGAARAPPEDDPLVTAPEVREREAARPDAPAPDEAKARPVTSVGSHGS